MNATDFAVSTDEMIAKWNNRLARRKDLMARGLSPAWYQVLHDFWQCDGGLLERIEAMTPEQITGFNKTVTLEQVAALCNKSIDPLP